MTPCEKRDELRRTVEGGVRGLVWVGVKDVQGKEREASAGRKEGSPSFSGRARTNV
jgi:hypothetical protein